MENDRRTLCKPCAIGLSSQGKRLKAVPGKSDKITCAACGRRRYGLTYEVDNRKGADMDGVGEVTQSRPTGKGNCGQAL